MPYTIKKDMNYKIERIYGHDDPDFDGDAWDVCLTKDGNVMLHGDFYHNHIDDRIEAYLKAVQDITGEKIHIKEITTKRLATEDEF